MIIVPAEAFLYGSLVGLPRANWLGWLVLGVFVSATLLFRVGPMLDEQGQFDVWFTRQRWSTATETLARQYRDGDLVLYGTRFVELDAVLRGEAPAIVADFASWPVRAHLPRDRDFDLRPLPYRNTPETKQYLLRELRRHGGRVWLIGLPEAIRNTLPIAEREGGLRVANRQRYGAVHLVLMTQDQHE